MNGNLTRGGHLTKLLNKLIKYNDIDLDKLSKISKYIIPAENAQAILENCANVDFFPNGCQAPSTREETIKIVDSMQNTLANLTKEIASHSQRRELAGSALYGQYTSGMRKIPNQGTQLMKRLNGQKELITQLIKRTANESLKEDFYKIKVVADKLVKEVDKAVKLLQRNYIVLANALVHARKTS